MTNILFRIFVVAWLASHPLARGQSTPAIQQAPGTIDGIEKLLDRIVERERSFVQSLRTHTPLIETYIQEIPDEAENARPAKDHYFLGRFSTSGTLEYSKLVERTDPPVGKTSRRRAAPQPGLSFLPRGFAQMAFVDLQHFDRNTYSFDFVRREFVGDVRSLVFDVAPKSRTQPGKFIGRIWVEDLDFSIVRFNGTYMRTPAPKGSTPELYFHFDSWRMNTGGSAWIPAQIYIEEEGDSAYKRFKAQSRIWDYAAAPENKLTELTNILIESQVPVRDEETQKDFSPLESQRSWEKQAEENVLARLEKGGLLAATGTVDQVLNTVLNNLIVSANLSIDARARVLLTTPIETFSVGHTIAISRGLIDVLPDETSLALLLATELSHIALGHRTPTQFAFNNQTMLSDAELLQRFRFRRSPEELLEAGKKTIDIMRASPYQNTAKAGLFLKALASHNAQLPMLLKANMGDQVADAEALDRLASFAESAPALEEGKLEQIAALPLGSRIKVNPWSNQIEMVKTRPLSLLSVREKMPFEVTPVVLHLTRDTENKITASKASERAHQTVRVDAAKLPEAEPTPGTGSQHGQ